jgi:hypothetical protein
MASKADELINNTLFVQTARMISWSSNYDFAKSPIACFLDMIGFSEEHFGQRMFRGGALGYLELDMIGWALIEYSDHPQDVEDFISAFMEAEVNE